MLKSKMTKGISLCLAVMMLLLGVPLNGFAAVTDEISGQQEGSIPVEVFTQSNDMEPEKKSEGLDDSSAYSSDSAPSGYVGDNTFLDVPQRRMMGMAKANAIDTQKKVLLIEDKNPWDSTANQIVLSGLTEYKKVTTAGFLNEDLSQYGVIVFANDQPFATYENYAEFKEYLEIFASIGGVIVFGACDAGWANGQLNEAIPGDVTKSNHYECYNYIANPTHPIVTGALTNNDSLTDSDLASYYCSHISFNEESLPPGTTVILRETRTNKPTLIEYPLGKGRVIASGLTWEHNYNHWGRTINGVKVGNFAKAMDDMFSYAIRVSSIDVKELHLLKEWRLKKIAHSIIVADGSSQSGEFLPIAGATVTIDGKKYVTDENGQVFYNENYGLHTAVVSASGYYERKLMYNMQERTSRIFFLEKKVNDGLPYIIQTNGVRNYSGIYLDLRDQALHYTENRTDVAALVIDGNWNGHGAGRYVIYQDPVVGEPGKYISSTTGVFTFSPGMVFKPNRQVKLKMIAGDGKESRPINLKLVIDRAPSQYGGGNNGGGNGGGNNGGNNNTGLKTGVDKFDWIGNHPVQSDNDIFTKILTTDMSISSELIPIEISSERDDDGTTIYKGVIGFISGSATKDLLTGKGEGFAIESPWDELKKQIKGYKTAGNPKAYFNNLKRKYGKDWKPSKLSATFDVEVNACGYLELKVGQNGNIISSDGGIVIDASGDFTIGRTFMAGPVPVYFEIKPGIGLEVNAGIEFYNADAGGLGFRPHFGSLTLEVPHITLEGGVGVRGVATVGLQGSGSLNIEFEPGNKTNGSLEFGGAIRVKVIFVVDYKWDFWNTSIKLWPKDNKMYRLFAARSLSFEEAELSLASRDYLDDCTAWNGGANKFLKLSANSADTTIKTLQEGVMPDALPQLQKVGDKLVMLFLRDVPERMTGNHTQLVYSVFDGGVWSEPKPVWDSETADFFFESVVDDGDLYVVWQKLKSVPTKETPEDLLAEVAQNSEICFAKWNDETNEFTSQSYLTDDDELDMYPNVAVRDDLVSVVWVTNNENDPTGESGDYIIKRKDIINDAMGDVSELYSTTEFVTEMAAGYSDEELQILYAVLEEDAEKSNIYLLKGATCESLNSGNESASLQFVNNVFLWHSEGAIYRYNPTTQVLAKIITGENGSASSSYKYVSNGAKSAIVWVDSEKNADTGEVRSVLKASIFADGEWSSPVVILDNLDTNISYMDIELLESGEYVAILNTASFSENQEVKTSLKFATIYPHNDVELLYAAVDKANAQSNKQPLTIYLANNGDSVIPSIELSVDANGNNYLYKTLDVSLNPGEQIELTEDIDISSINSVTVADVTVNIDEDSKPDNNRTQITLGHVDVSLSLDTYDLGDSVVFALTARNEANTVAHAAISIREDSPEGIVLDIKNIGEVSNDANVQYLYQIDKTQVQFDESNTKTYFFKLESLEEDWNTEDNQQFYVITKNPDETDVNPEGIMEEVKIIQPTSVDISVNKLHFDSVDSDSVQLGTNIYPANSSIKNVLWSVEDPDVVHVDSGGLVTPLRPGTTTITSKVTDEVFDTITVTVADSSVLYKISAKAGTGGTVSGAGTFASGTEVTLTARPNTNYTFEGWYEGGRKIDGAGATYTFTVSKERMLEARFSYNVTGGGGYTGGSSGGSDNTISATLDVSEFKFDKSAPADITVKLSSGSYAFREIKNGSYKLIPNQDYIVNGNMFTIKAAYLETLEDGQATLTFTMSGGSNPVLTVTVESGASQVTEGDGILLNGKETELKLNPDGSVTINEEDISELSKPVILTLPYKDGGNSHVGVLKKDGQDVVMPFSVYKDNAMIILISEPGTYGVINNKKNFNDIDGHWAVNTIDFISSRGIFSGIGDEIFDPNGGMTRAMFATVLSKLDGADLSGYKTSAFTDVDINMWYGPAIAWAADKGIISGYGDGLFRPDDLITREQMAVMLRKYMQYKGINLDAKEYAEFADDDKISSWAKEAVADMKRYGLIAGVGNNLYAPQDTANRASVGQIIMNFIYAYIG